MKRGTKTGKKRGEAAGKSRYSAYHFSMKGLEGSDPNRPGYESFEDSAKQSVVVGKRLVKARIALLLAVTCYVLYREFPALVADPSLGGMLSSLSVVIGGICVVVAGWKYATAFQMPATTQEVVRYRDDIEKKIRRNLYKEGHRKK